MRSKQVTEFNYSSAEVQPRPKLLDQCLHESSCNTRQCRKCEAVKELCRFYDTPNGNKRRVCKRCLLDDVARYHASDSGKKAILKLRSKPGFNEDRAARTRENRRLNPIRCQLNGIRRRCREQGLEFNLSESDIIIPDRCPVLGIALERSGDINNSPSIDRVDPSGGYVKGNIQVISFRANRIKNDATLEELEKLVAFLKYNANTK